MSSKHSVSGLASKIKALMPRAPAKYISPLITAMHRNHIDTPKRMAAFLSQIAVESNELNHMREKWSSKKDFKLPGVKSREAFTAKDQKEYFEHWYGERAGNTTKEDGYTYRGRGAIQITGKENYKWLEDGIGKPLVEHPELLDEPGVGMLASAYYFSHHPTRHRRLLPEADKVDPSDEHSVFVTNLHLTKGVNGGTNNLSERQGYYKKALKLLGAEGAEGD